MGWIDGLFWGRITLTRSIPFPPHIHNQPGLFGRLRYGAKSDASVHTQVKGGTDAVSTLTKSSNTTLSEVQHGYRYWHVTHSVFGGRMDGWMG